MAYARMRATSRDALICDFAQYYRIYDLDQVDLKTGTVLACGLPPGSRTVMALTGQKVPLEIMLQAATIDAVRNIEYILCRRFLKGKQDRPKSLLKTLTGSGTEDGEIKTFTTHEEFEAAKQRIIRGNNDG